MAPIPTIRFRIGTCVIGPAAFGGDAGATTP